MHEASYLEAEPVVAIAQKRSFEPSESLKKFETARAPLLQALAERAVRGVYISGAEHRTSDDSVERYYEADFSPKEEQLTINAALDLTGGIARYMPGVRALNPLGVRELAMSKHRQYPVLAAALGDAVPETLVTTAARSEVVAAIEATRADKIILKASIDVNKKHPMLVGNKAEIFKQLDTLLMSVDPVRDMLVVQEYIEEAQADFAKGIRFFDDNEKAKAADGKFGRELRVHMIDDQPALVVGRVGLDPQNKSPEDAWVFLDQDSVPSHVHDLAAAAVRAIAREANATDSYLAVDLTPDGKRLIEVNGRIIGAHRASADRAGQQAAHTVMTGAIADKLASMAYKRKGEA